MEVLVKGSQNKSWSEKQKKLLSAKSKYGTKPRNKYEDMKPEDVEFLRAYGSRKDNRAYDRYRMKRDFGKLKI